MDGDRPGPSSESPAGLSPVTQAALDVETYCIVRPDGSHDPDRVPPLSETTLRDLYRWMVFQRRIDERCVALQRRGQLGTYPPARGQEASIVGAGFALADEDWLFPYGREATMLLLHGFSLRDLLLYWRGVNTGDRMAEANVAGVSIAIGSHIPVLAGVAWGMDLSGADSVAVANLGDGATSTGAFHEGLNLAGTLGAPAVLFCQNNQYAISLPFEEQTAADTVAQKAVAYGVDGVRVDGNDALAVYAAVSAARERALAGTSTLVEAVTYRQAAHTTSDDPTRYREESEVEEWGERDPIDRYEAFLREADLWEAVDPERVEAEVDEAFDAAREAADEVAAREPEEMFAHVYADLPANLQSQLEGYRDLLADRPDLADHVERRPKG